MRTYNKRLVDFSTKTKGDAQQLLMVNITFDRSLNLVASLRPNTLHNLQIDKTTIPPRTKYHHYTTETAAKSVLTQESDC